MVKKVKAKKPEETANASPKASPKAAPADAPKVQDQKKKQEKNKAEKTGVDKAEKEKLTKEALDIILKGISQPDAQKNGQTFHPPDWHTKYKAVLGGYKKFVQSQPEKLSVMEGAGGNFVVRKAGDTTPCPGMATKKKGGGGDWKQDLTKAWSTYCSATPKHERSIEAFVAALPQGVRNTKPEAAVAKSPQLSPKMSPKASPAAAPAEGGGKKKKKANAETAPADDSKKRKEPPAEEAAPAGGKKKKKAKTA